MFIARPRHQPQGQSELCCSPKAMLILAIVLLTIGGIVAYVGVFTPYLLILDFEGFGFSVTYHIGIYTLCGVSIGTVVSCGTLINADEIINPDWVKGCQALGFLASIAAFVGWIMLLCWLCQTAKTKCLKWSILVLVLLAVLCFAVALILWAVEYDELWGDYNLAWGYYVAWVGVVLMIVAAVLLMLHPTGPPYQQQQMMAYGTPMGQPMAQPGYQPYQRPQPTYQSHPQPMYQPQPQPMQQPMQMYPQSQLSGAYSNPSAVSYGGYNTGYR